MELNKDIWYVRLFFWTLEVYYAFRNEKYCFSRSHVERTGTNLCFFVRVIVLYAPLILLLNVVFVAAAVASVTAIPIYFFGATFYGWTLFFITLGMLTVLGLMRTVRQNALNGY